MNAAASSTLRTPRSPIYSMNFGEFKSSKTNSASIAGSSSRKTSRSVSSIVTPLFFERLDLARFAQHLVDLVEMHFLEQDHLAGVFLKRDRIALGKL